MFEFATAGKIVFGEGIIDQLPELVRGFGRNVLLFMGTAREDTINAWRGIEQAGCAVRAFQVRREPTVDDISAALDAVRDHAADVVVAIGGGSVIDTAKAAAAVSTNPGPLLDYLEVIGAGKALAQPGLPCIAVPTTAGTGAEVTRNAVIGVPEQAAKVSLRSHYLLPRVALLDPQLMVGLSPAVTAATGFDALAQVIEPFVCNRPNPVTDALAKAGIALAATSLRRAYRHGGDIAARSDMALVSLWGGMCLANARLGAVHGLAGPIGGQYHVPHGAVCAALLGPVMRTNTAALQRQFELDGSTGAILERYTEVARLLTGKSSARIEDGLVYIEQLASDMGINKLGQLGIAKDQFDSIVERAQRASSMQGNPVKLQSAEIAAILEAAL